MVDFKRSLRIGSMMLIAAMTFPRASFAGVCNQENVAGVKYNLCTVEPGKADLRLFWKNADGEAYRHFSKLAKAVEGEGGKLVFALNAGMYQTDFSPMGLYVEDGQQLHAADLTQFRAPSGQVPNFYKKPNAVFYLDGEQAGILPTSEFIKRRPRVRYATQSGPMLVIDNKINPIFIAGSKYRTRRSGVGICRDGNIRFAVSEDSVNFYDFARLFRDHLKCPVALFLDGGRGAGVFSPELGRNDISWHGGYGPLIGLIQ